MWENISECGYGDYNDRYFYTSSEPNQVIGPYCFNSCEDCEIPNKSLSFNGNDNYVDTGIPYTSLSGATALEFEFQFKRRSGNNDGQYQGIISSLTSGNSQIFIRISDQNYLELGFKNDNSNFSTEFYDSELILFDKWYNFKIVLQNDQVLWYSNEVLIEVDDVNFQSLGQESNNVPTLSFGRGNTVYGEYFDGFLDDVKISINNDDNYIAYYDFNDGEGQILSDITGNNDAIIYGATWSDDVPQPLHLGPNWFVSIGEGSDENNGSEDYPFSSIQRAINAANENDSIYVSSGVYFENLFISEKNISLTSIDGPESTIIDGNSENRVVHINFSNSDSLIVPAGILLLMVLQLRMEYGMQAVRV